MNRKRDAKGRFVSGGNEQPPQNTAAAAQLQIVIAEPEQELALETDDQIIGREVITKVRWEPPSLFHPRGRWRPLLPVKGELWTRIPPEERGLAVQLRPVGNGGKPIPKNPIICSSPEEANRTTIEIAHTLMNGCKVVKLRKNRH